MADFVAVIRRAVDGLSDNSPEMRVKVYEKARGAVQRQLESMKPRPPEEMLRRQLEKLETAITEVEGDYAEALPAIDANDGFDRQTPIAITPEVQPEAVAPVPSPPAATTAADEYDQWGDTVVATAPVAAAVVTARVPEPVEEPLPEPDPVIAAAEPVVEVAEPEPVRPEPEPEAQHPALWPEVDEAKAAAIAAAARRSAGPVWGDEPEPEVEPAPYEPVAELEPEPEPEPEIAAPVAAEPYDWAAAQTPAPGAVAAGLRYADETAPLSVSEQFEPAETVAEAAAVVPAWHDAAAEDEAPSVPEPQHDVPEWAQIEDEIEAEPVRSVPPVDAATVQQDFADFVGAEPVVAEPERTEVATDDPKMPPALDLLAWDESSFEDSFPPDTGADGKPARPEPVVAEDVEAAPAVASVAPVAAEPAPRSAWNDLEDLIGYDRAADATAPRDPELTPPDLDMLVAKKQPPSFRAAPKRRFNYTAMILTLLAIGLLGGAGYAAWLNRDALNAMVADLVSSAPTTTAETPTTPVATTDTSTSPTTPATTPTATATTPATPATPTDTQTASNTQPTASATSNDGAAVGTKFTQRLQTDGTELDSGPAIQPGETAAAEGKSVAAQSVASADAPSATPTPPVSGTVTATPAATPTTDTQPQQIAPVGGGEKMFLYEERLGQSVPTALEGNVAWSLQQENDESGKPQPTIQAQITVPERGLSALLTFKRNTDPSLPASHLVEIVFSLPKDFEGGAIESVQRIAMKQTEQDRGNALIAVPAKITDDFHMIALNDYPEARTTNLDLLRSRNWIDIPITYRNGRRALLTLEKGPAGIEAFTTAIREWQAMGDKPAGQ